MFSARQGGHFGSVSHQPRPFAYVHRIVKTTITIYWLYVYALGKSRNHGLVTRSWSSQLAYNKLLQSIKQAIIPISQPDPIPKKTWSKKNSTANARDLTANEIAAAD